MASASPWLAEAGEREAAQPFADGDSGVQEQTAGPAQTAGWWRTAGWGRAAGHSSAWWAAGGASAAGTSWAAAGTSRAAASAAGSSAASGRAQAWSCWCASWQPSPASMRWLRPSLPHRPRHPRIRLLPVINVNFVKISPEMSEL